MLNKQLLGETDSIPASLIFENTLLDGHAGTTHSHQRPNTTVAGITDQEREMLGKLKTTNRPEYRRQVHLICEHRRRTLIQSGISSLEQLLPANPTRHRRLSKAGIITYSVEHIENLKLQLANLEQEHATLQVENKSLTKQVEEAGGKV